MITTIPLDKLVRSPRNVRRSSDPDADLQLKADIGARGLLQNLVVTRVPKPRGAFAVEAGDRRLRALQALAEDGRIEATHEIICLVLDGDPAAAQEASLAENFQHLRMNPADECLAFQRMLEQGSDAEHVARRFGLSTRFVEGRLRLASLAPVVFAALGAGDISLDVAKAYAATPDQERQTYVFEQMGRGYSAHHPDSIRRMMTQATINGGDRRARFVGEEDYVAGGGRIERDLFAEDAATHWLDIALLERLASEKLERLAADTVRELEIGFVRPTLDRFLGYAHTQGLRRVAIEAPALTEAERMQVEELQLELDGLADLLQDDATEEQARADADARIQELSDRIEDITRKPAVIDPSLKSSIGTFLLLDDQGRPRLEPVFYIADVPEPVDGGERDDASPDDASPIAPAAAPQREAGLSQRLVDELAIQRRDILAVHLASDPALALDLIIFLMADREAGFHSEKSGSSLSAAPPANPVLDFETPDAPATIARAEASAALDRTWNGGDSRAERFEAFRALSEAARAAWLGHCVALTLEASLHLPGERSCAFHDHLGQLIGIDVAAWWRPTGATFFDRLPKSVTLAALAEVGGESFAARYSKAKKVELAQSCERIFSGDFIAEVEVKEAARGWVPAAMSFGLRPVGMPALNDELLAQESSIQSEGSEAQIAKSEPCAAVEDAT